MDTASYRLPEEIVIEVARLAEERGITKSELVREALADYVGRASRGAANRVALLEVILRDEPGVGVTDLADRAEEYLRAGFATGAHPVSPRGEGHPAKRPPARKMPPATKGRAAKREPTPRAGSARAATRGRRTP